MGKTNKVPGSSNQGSPESSLKHSSSDLKKSDSTNIFQPVAFNPWVEHVSNITGKKKVEKILPIMLRTAEKFKNYLKDACENNKVERLPEDFLTDVAKTLDKEFVDLSHDQRDRVIRVIFNLMYDIALDFRNYEVEYLNKLLNEQAAIDEVRRSQQRVLFLETITFMLYSPKRVTISKLFNTVRIIPEYSEGYHEIDDKGYDPLFDEKDPPEPFPWGDVAGKDITGRTVILSDKDIPKKVLIKKWENIGYLFTSPEEQFKEEFKEYFTRLNLVQMYYNEQAEDMEYRRAIHYVPPEKIMIQMIKGTLRSGKYYEPDNSKGINWDDYYIEHFVREDLNYAIKALHKIGHSLRYVTKDEFINIVMMGMIKFIDKELATLKEHIEKEYLEGEDLDKYVNLPRPSELRFKHPLDRITYKTFLEKINLYHLYKEYKESLTLYTTKEIYKELLTDIYEKTGQAKYMKKRVVSNKTPRWLRNLLKYVKCLT